MRIVNQDILTTRRKISLWALKELKESYGISLQVIMYRAHSLGLVTDRQLRHFRETIKANGCPQKIKRSRLICRCLLEYRHRGFLCPGPSIRRGF